MTKKIAFLFPGQGSQTVGMLNELADRFMLIKKTCDEASVALEYDLWQLIADDLEEKLQQTMYTQPALLAASIAIWRVLQSQGMNEASFFAGHSLGEYSALVAAGSLTFNDALRLVAKRGELMQQAVQPGQGAMAALIGLTPEQVAELCVQAADGEVLAPANYNAIGQIVVSGNTAAVDRVMLLAKDSGAKMAKKLPVSVPSHCKLMESAADQFKQYLQNTPLQRPNKPIINNVDAAINNHPDDIRDALFRQLYSPVRWVDTVQRLVGEGVNTMIECGPGKVLTGLVKRIDRQVKVLTANEVLGG